MTTGRHESSPGEAKFSPPPDFLVVTINKTLKIRRVFISTFSLIELISHVKRVLLYFTMFMSLNL